MRTSVTNVDNTIILVSKFDNTDELKAFTADEIEYYVTGMIDNYSIESDEEEALLALIQGFKAATSNIREGTVLSTDS